MIYGITDVGMRMTISIDTDKKPTSKYIKKLTKILESTKNEKSLKTYYTHVQFLVCDVVMEDDNEERIKSS